MQVPGLTYDEPCISTSLRNVISTYGPGHGLRAMCDVDHGHREWPYHTIQVTLHKLLNWLSNGRRKCVTAGGGLWKNKTVSPSQPVWAVLTTDCQPIKNSHLVRCYILNGARELNRLPITSTYIVSLFSINTLHYIQTAKQLSIVINDALQYANKTFTIIKEPPLMNLY